MLHSILAYFASFDPKIKHNIQASLSYNSISISNPEIYFPNNLCPVSLGQKRKEQEKSGEKLKASS